MKLILCPYFMCPVCGCQMVAQAIREKPRFDSPIHFEATHATVDGCTNSGSILIVEIGDLPIVEAKRKK